jgi:hypothetical protein
MKITIAALPAAPSMARSVTSVLNGLDLYRKARAVIFAKTGVDADPDWTEFENVGGDPPKLSI